VVATRLLLAVPVLLALALASVSPSPQAAAQPAPADPAPMPQVGPPVPPALPPGHPPVPRADDECTCTRSLLWQECEPAWHRDLQPDDRHPWRPRRPAPGSQDGPI